MVAEEEKKQVLYCLSNRKKTKQAFSQGVDYINKVLRDGVMDDITFLSSLFRLMFKASKEMKTRQFMLEKALINICYKYFNSELLDLLEKEIDKQKKKFRIKHQNFNNFEDLGEFCNVYCSFGILKLKYFGVKIDKLDHFVNFCDVKYREKIKILEKKESPVQNIDLNNCFIRFKTFPEHLENAFSFQDVDYDVKMYFSLEDFYTLNANILNFKFSKLISMTSFQNNLERQIKKCLELIFQKRFAESKSHLKDLRKNDLYKNHNEVRHHVYNLLILCHAELAEYFECLHYINLAINESTINNMNFVYFYFLNLKFAIERIGCIEGPRSCILFDFEDVKERKIDIKRLMEMDQVDLNSHLRDCKLATQIFLSIVKDDIRELRNLETYKTLHIEKLFANLQISLQKYSVISLYVINDILYINLFDKIINTKINFKDFSAKLNTILASSKDVLRRNICSQKDKSDWWIERLNLDSKLCRLLKDVKINLELINEHVILILDEKSTNFPWEHTSFLRDKHVFRIPSLEYLDIKEMKRPVEGFSWIIDPDNNLEDTRKRILNYFNTKKFTKNEENFNVLFYFGHGGGSKFLKNIKNKILFLFGCCSSKILNVQNFKRNGKVLNHLERGNTLIGCLWEVTDKDLDMISMKIIDNLFNNKCLACIIKESIGIAKLPYLNGCSLVVYGLPVVLKI